jgi:hypothetical protein
MPPDKSLICCINLCRLHVDTRAGQRPGNNAEGLVKKGPHGRHIAGDGRHTFPAGGSPRHPRTPSARELARYGQAGPQDPRRARRYRVPRGPASASNRRRRIGALCRVGSGDGARAACPAGRHIYAVSAGGSERKQCDRQRGSRGAAARVRRWFNKPALVMNCYQFIGQRATRTRVPWRRKTTFVGWREHPARLLRLASGNRRSVGLSLWAAP